MADVPRIPFIDFRAQFESVREEVMAAVEEVFESQAFILGPAVERFERRLAERLGLAAGAVVGVSSGTDALLVALMALGVGPGDRVLTTPFSFFATAGVIARLHATPEFVDIERDTFNLDPRRLEDLDPARYKAVIPVHVFGRTADLEAVSSWAAPAGVPVVEDAAQAIGGVDPAGRPCGTLGLMGCFSFYPTKNIGAAGDAGCVTTGDAELADRLRALRVHGAYRKYESVMVGGNFRLDSVQAAVLGAKLRHLDEWTRRRLENARRYDLLLRERGLQGELALPQVTDDGCYIAHQYVVRTRLRDELRSWLAERGIGTAVYYPRPFHLMECFADLGYREGDFPESEAATREALALPIFPELGAERQARVVDAVAAFFERSVGAPQT